MLGRVTATATAAPASTSPMARATIFRRRRRKKTLGPSSPMSFSPSRLPSDGGADGFTLGKPTLQRKGSLTQHPLGETQVVLAQWPVGRRRQKRGPRGPAGSYQASPPLAC